MKIGGVLVLAGRGDQTVDVGRLADLADLALGAVEPGDGTALARWLAEDRPRYSRALSLKRYEAIAATLREQAGDGCIKAEEAPRPAPARAHQDGARAGFEIDCPTQRMANAMPRPRTYRETAEDLAGAHRRVDPTTTQIMLVPDPAQAEIRLIEVSASAPWSGDVIPFPFDARPDLGVFYPSVVILLNPREWQDVEAGRLPLPAGWDLRAREDL